MSKWCPDCRSEKPLSAFTKDSRRKDGLSFYCRACRIAREEASRRNRFGPRRHRVKPREVVVPDEHKWCPECGTVKALTEFPRNRRARSGYMTYCKPCHKVVTKRHLDRNGGERNYRLRRRYGITVEHFDRMFAEQHGKCAVCWEAPAEHVDHDHATGRVRGLLCFNCNGALGQFRDRSDLMVRAIAYLHRDATRPIDAMSRFGVGLVLGDMTSPRPDDEPAPGAA